jgi:hypothetical protein
MSAQSRTHKHVRIGHAVYSVDLDQTDARKWVCGDAWGPSPKAAAREAHAYDCAMHGTTVAELHHLES